MARDKLKALPENSQIGQIRVEKALGQGGFGVTYLARTGKTAGREVVLKEYMPAGLTGRRSDKVTVFVRKRRDDAVFADGLKAFVKSGRALAKLRHPGLVSVSRCTRAHGTAYMVAEHIDRETLAETLSRREQRGESPFDDDGLRVFAWALLDGADALHKAGLIHRSIKPASICLRADGSPVLLGYGSVSMVWETGGTHPFPTLAEGYSAPELYEADGNQGPWTDVYSLAAVLYRIVARERPPDAEQRLEARRNKQPDPLSPATVKGAGRYPQSLLEGIDRGLELRSYKRPQSVNEWRQLLEHGAPETAPPLDPEARERQRGGGMNAIAAGVTLALLLTGTIVLAFQLFPDSAEVPAEVQAQRVAEEEVRLKEIARQQALAEKKRASALAAAREREAREAAQREAEATALRAMIATAAEKAANEDKARREARLRRQVAEARRLAEEAEERALEAERRAAQERAVAKRAIDRAKQGATSTAGLKRLIAGSTFQFERSGGLPSKSFLIRFDPAGGLQGVFDGGSEQDTDTGTWWVEKDRLCVRWTRWDFGEERCYGIAGKGPSFRAFGSSGTLSGPFMIIR